MSKLDKAGILVSKINGYLLLCNDFNDEFTPEERKLWKRKHSKCRRIRRKLLKIGNNK